MPQMDFLDAKGSGDKKKRTPCNVIQVKIAANYIKIASGLSQKKWVQAGPGQGDIFLYKRNDIRGMVISIICMSYTDPFLLFLGSRLFVIFC